MTKKKTTTMRARRTPKVTRKDSPTASNARESRAKMSRQGLQTLHGLIVDAWRTLRQYETSCPKDFAPAAEHGAGNLRAAMKLIERRLASLGKRHTR